MSNNSAALERHLKKIYDCLNIGCNKKAVQEVDRLPKNFRDMTVFKALKSLALIRLYKRRQAFEILQEIDPHDDLDEATLQTMTSCYKESVDVNKIVELYEAASKRRPNDQEIMAHLFMAYVRVFNFKRQKEIALHMYRFCIEKPIHAKKKRLYTFWAIMSLVMQSQKTQVITGDNKAEDNSVYLTLAERMCERMMDDERTQEEIELYLMILRKQQKHEDEYRFLTGPICLRITDHLSWYNRRRAYLCLDLKMYSRAFKHYFPTLIQEYPDQIEYYQGLFKSAFLLDTEAPSQQQPVAMNDQQPQNSNQSAGTPVKSTSALSECYDIVERQCQYSLEFVEQNKDQQKGKSQPISKNLSRTSSLNPNRPRLLRGPLIARAELYRTITSNESHLPKNIFNQCMSQFGARFTSISALLLDYFQSFGKKIICYYDLDYLIKQLELSSEEKEELVSKVEDWVHDNKQNDYTESDRFHILLNYHMLKHSIHKYSVDDARELRFKIAREYIDLYDANRHLGKNANKTEMLPVDHYCLLAINSIMTNSLSLDKLKSKSILNDRLIVSLIVMAEVAITNSPSNHQLKLILLKLYSFIGASKQSSEVLLSLDIKHFQIDTLGHLLNPVLYNTGNYSLSRESLDTCLDFYTHGVRECFEGLTTSYRDGRFSKIEEISNVLMRLNYSLNSLQCILLRGIVANLFAGTLDELNAASQTFDPYSSLHNLYQEECCEKVRDNRDFKVLKSLHIDTNQLIETRRNETLEDEDAWSKMRFYLIKSVYVQAELFGAQVTRDLKAKHIEELNYNSQKFDQLIPTVEKIASLSFDGKPFSYLEPESSPLRWKHIDTNLLIAIVRPLVFCPKLQDLTNEIQLDYTRHLDTIINNLENQLSSVNCLISMKQALLSTSITIEFISLCVTSLVSIVQADPSNSGITNSITNAKSSHSSSQQPPQQQPTSSSKSKSVVQVMINKTEAQLTRLSNLIKALDPKVLLAEKVQDLEELLVSDQKHSTIETKDGAIIHPLMGHYAAQTTLIKVKEKLIDSYSESLKEFEMTCRRKMKLLRSRM